jgi:hypothetical protein
MWRTRGAAGRSPWCTDGRILPTSGANRHEVREEEGATVSANAILNACRAWQWAEIGAPFPSAKPRNAP